MKPLTLLEPNHRILIIDDNRAIHDDLRKILCGEVQQQADLQDDEAFLFGTVPLTITDFEVESAYQGEEGLQMVARAVAAGRPYALAFVDVRMPPGWDGVETLVHLREVDPNLQTVICTAYSDYSWSDMQRRLGHSENLLILKKPFDNIEIIQLAATLSQKWFASRQAETKMADLDRMVALRTTELEAANRLIQKQLEEIAKAEEAFRVIFQTSPIAISLMGGDGGVVDVNQAFETLYKVAKPAVVGKTARQLSLADDVTLGQVRSELAENGAVNAKEVVHETVSEGATTLLWVRKVEIGNEPHLLSFSLDISERKSMEEQLRMARTAAEAASKAKSEFLANMSHEIRTPMNGIIGFTQLTLGTELTDEQRDYLETVEGSADSLLRIINDILDFSKIEAGRLDMDEAPFSLRECVEGTTKSLLAVAQGKGLLLQCEVASEVPDSVVGDSVRLRQILLNLIGNALKFTSDGSVQLRVVAEPFGYHSMVARFSVHDTGIGIPDSKRQFIFEAFRQADGSTNRKYGGTGLGLAISSRLVEMMGGRIWVESEEGKGSTFFFTLPLNFVLPVEPGPADSLTSEHVPMSILLAEDDPASQELVSTLLEQEGNTITVARNGAEVLSILERQSFDLILMDIQMPQMDGFQATAEIRDLERQSGAHVPIIALTAHALKGDRERCIEAGMDDYLSKPVQAAQLLAAVARFTGKRVAAIGNCRQ